ncbi:hypothetical protein EVAR_12571_1 [Eumeta japonica]|uniref:Uncharacterized protein n=1 Tax=Eumeta variegata TaxID=151549 RepID=A0A4C1UFL7_EUMVA|nr:hypothetical protein EVAR_12571_1 [Eumeta japonica]
MAANVNERLILEWLMEEDGNSSGSSSNDEEEYTVEQSAPCQSPHESESEQDQSEAEEILKTFGITQEALESSWFTLPCLRVDFDSYYVFFDLMMLEIDKFGKKLID